MRDQIILFILNIGSGTWREHWKFLALLAFFWVLVGIMVWVGIR